MLEPTLLEALQIVLPCGTLSSMIFYNLRGKSCLDEQRWWIHVFRPVGWNWIISMAGLTPPYVITVHRSALVKNAGQNLKTVGLKRWFKTLQLDVTWSGCGGYLPTTIPLGFECQYGGFRVSGTSQQNQRGPQNQLIPVLLTFLNVNLNYWTEQSFSPALVLVINIKDSNSFPHWFCRSWRSTPTHRWATKRSSRWSRGSGWRRSGERGGEHLHAKPVSSSSLCSASLLSLTCLFLFVPLSLFSSRR